MIFNKEFDKSLLLILNGDNKNKKLILNFIDSIPITLYKKMLDGFVEYKKQKEIDNIYMLEKEEIKSEMVIDNIKYYFVIDLIFNCLIVGRSSLKNGEYNKDFELALFSDSSYNKLEVFDNQFLGSIDGTLIDNRINYDLVNTFLGVMIVKRENNSLSRYKRIDINKFIDDMNKNNKTRIKKKC